MNKRHLHHQDRRAFGGPVTMVAALLAGAIVAWSQAAPVTAHESETAVEAGKNQRVVQVLKDLLNGLSPWTGRSRDVTAETACRHFLDEAAERIGEALKVHPDIEAELRTTLGFVYYDLDDCAKAEEMHRKALELRRTLAAPRETATGAPGRPPARSSWHGDEDPTVAASIYNLGQVLFAQGRYGEAKARFEEALALNRERSGNATPKVANCLDHLSVLAMQEGKLVEAEAMAREALAIRRSQFGNEHWDVASSLLGMARVFKAKGQWPEAANASREALILNRRFFGEAHFEVAVSRVWLADLLIESGPQENLQEAEALIRAALPNLQRAIGRDHVATRQSYRDLASILRQQGRDAEAEKLLRDLATKDQEK